MASVLVYSHFCPARPSAGGVQIVLRPLLDEIQRTGWQVGIAHLGPCEVPSHVALPIGREPWTEFVDPARLVRHTTALREVAAEHEVVLSVDRVLPDLPRPRVLMSNSMAYIEESHALLAGSWSAVAVPSAPHGRACHELVGGVAPVVIPYGLPEDDLAALASIRRRSSSRKVVNILVPHRADRRKGQRIVLEGLRSDPALRCRISWLENEHDAAFRIELEQCVEAWNLEEQVEFTGWQADASRFANLEWADAVVQLGTFVETFGLSIVEAALAGRVVVTGPQPAIRSILGQSAQYQELDDPTSWTSALSVAEEIQTRVIDEIHAALSMTTMARSYGELLARAL